jgi:hypothetical protein
MLYVFSGGARPVVDSQRLWDSYVVGYNVSVVERHAQPGCYRFHFRLIYALCVANTFCIGVACVLHVERDCNAVAVL